jgi:hypothetical protein
MNTAPDSDSLITSLGGNITIGTDQPLQRSGSGAFLELKNGARVSTKQVVELDTALLAASAPLVDMAGTSTSLTASIDAIALTQKAKLTAIRARLPDRRQHAQRHRLADPSAEAAGSRSPAIFSASKTTESSTSPTAPCSPRSAGPSSTSRARS